MRLVFAGTPEVALPSLDALVASRHDVVAVVSRPDARVGRGRTLSPSPVKARAEELGIEVLTPGRPSEPDFIARLTELAPDACPVVAYGALIPQAVLDIPAHGWVNLHFSLLPAWRGAAPVQRALIAGDEFTGASTFRLEAGLDTGPVFGILTDRIQPRDTSGDLLGRLAEAGASLLVHTLDGIEDGTVEAVEQPGEGISHAPKLEVTDAEIDWRTPALAIDRLVRGCTPAPGAWTTFRGQRLGLGPLEVAGDSVGIDLAPGQVLAGKREVLVGTVSAPVRLGEVRHQGKKPMPAADWARGVRPADDERLGA